VRLDSPFALAVIGTLAIHVLAVTAGDALVVLRPPTPPIPAPRIELVEVEVPPVVTPPPPPVTPPPAPAVEEPRPAPRPRVARAAPSQIRSTPPPTVPPPSEVPSGGDPVVQMDDIAPSATGVGVAVGKPNTGHVGRGGTGGGTGAGSGSGTGDELSRTVSIATIKTLAMPKGDYDYFSAGKDYPAEARALRIEGKIRVRLRVDERGKVTSRVLINKLGHGLDELALARAADLEFEPARDSDDRPVASVVTWTFNFTLPR
jgi:periplasmic protein TonB